MIRLTVSPAFSVWRVEKTRWPVSAAWSATDIVSGSRISPTRMTSGSSRRAARSAMAKLAESRSEEHTSELQSRELISYAVFCLKKKKKKNKITKKLSNKQNKHK